MLIARRLACGPCRSRHGWPGPPRGRPSGSPSRRRPGAGATPSSTTRPRAGAAELAARGAVPGERVAIALAPGLGFAPGAPRLPAAGRRGRAGRPAPVGRRAGADRGGRERARRSAAGGAGAERRGFGRSPPRSRRDRDDRAHLGHHLGAAAGGAELREHPLERARLGRRRSASTPEERWLCALPLSHVGGLSILLRSAIYATTAVVHERFETEPVLAALREGSVTLVSLVATTLARLLEAGLERPPALRCALTGGGPVPRHLVERGGTAGVAGVAHVRPHRGLLAGDDDPRGGGEGGHGHGRAAAVLHPCAGRRRTARSSSPGRPSRPRRRW